MPNQTLLDPAIQESPYDYYAEVLHNAPLVFEERASFWICGDYELMREILRNTEVFRSHGSQSIEGLRPPPPEALAIQRALVRPVDTMVTADPPIHGRVRAMMDNPYKPKNVAALAPSIKAIIHETIDEFIDAGHCDFVAAYAVPVPVKVIADQLGLPRSYAPKIKEWSDAAVEPLGMMVSDERIVACARSTADFQREITAALEERRAEPRDDLLSHVANVRDEQGQLFSLAEMLSITSQLLVAGNESTTNSIAAGMRRLIEQPELIDRLRAEPERARNFAEEILRHESPVQGLFRIVARDMSIGGVQLREGDRVMVRFGAANRDPNKYECPHAFDIDRANAATHVAFGAGIHHCLGANLAKEELAQTFAILPRRLDKLRFTPSRNDFAHHPNMVLRGLKHLYIDFERRGD